MACHLDRLDWYLSDYTVQGGVELCWTSSWLSGLCVEACAITFFFFTWSMKKGQPRPIMGRSAGKRTGATGEDSPRSLKTKSHRKKSMVAIRLVWSTVCQFHRHRCLFADNLDWFLPRSLHSFSTVLHNVAIGRLIRRPSWNSLCPIDCHFCLLLTCPCVSSPYTDEDLRLLLSQARVLRRDDADLWTFSEY